VDPLRVSGDSKASVERGVRIDTNSAAAGLSCAEYAVSTRFDRAAGDGVPAHITVIYPFKSLELMTTDDHRRLVENHGRVQHDFSTSQPNRWVR